MCGIIGYIGKKEAAPIILGGLKAMEYRGYDSSGLVVIDSGGGIKAEKAVGRIAQLEEKLAGGLPAGTVGCGHTRWATHGLVTEENAHPHADCAGNIWIAHNGIIENYKELKQKLVAHGHTFRSETDSEVLAHLIEEESQTEKIPFEEAVRTALRHVQGTYGLVALDQRRPDVLVAVRNFSPLVLGVADHGTFVASDASALLKHTRQVVYLDDGEMAVLTPTNHSVYDLRMNVREKKMQELEWSQEEVKKDGFAHFMLKEIYDEPDAIKNSIRGRLVFEEGKAKLGGLVDVRERLAKIKRLIIAGCGTSYFAGKVGEYMLEEYAGIPVEVELASEFRYRKPILNSDDALLVISQSGETADTLAAVREAKEKGALTLGIVNVVGSTIARETDAGVYQHVGPEISVASTKAFASQVAILSLFTLFLGRQRGMSLVTGQRIGQELSRIPELMQKIFAQKQDIERIAKKYNAHDNFLYLGRKYNMPVAYEGALKIKEVAYVHAEGYSAGEMKHGPIAMIDENFPCVCIVPADSVYEKMVSNIEEIKARRGKIIAIATEGDSKIRELTEDVIFIPKTLEMLTPLLAVVPLQLFAYYAAVGRGRDVDRPRNLAKSVTVE